MIFTIIALMIVGGICFNIKYNADKLIDRIPLSWIAGQKLQHAIRVTLKVIISLVLGIFYLGLAFLFIVLMSASENSKNSKK